MSHPYIHISNMHSVSLCLCFLFLGVFIVPICLPKDISFSWCRWWFGRLTSRSATAHLRRLLRCHPKLDELDGVAKDASGVEYLQWWTGVTCRKVIQCQSATNVLWIYHTWIAWVETTLQVDCQVWMVFVIGTRFTRKSAVQIIRWHSLDETPWDILRLA